MNKLEQLLNSSFKSIDGSDMTEEEKIIHIYKSAIEDAKNALPKEVDVGEATHEIPVDSMVAADQARNYTIRETITNLEALTKDV